MTLPINSQVIPVPVAAAVKTSSGLIYTMPPPHRHHHILHAVHEARNAEGLIIGLGTQGFLMSDGTCADRVTAAKAALDSGRISRLAHPPNLYSEDLW